MQTCESPAKAPDRRGYRTWDSARQPQHSFGQRVAAGDPFHKRMAIGETDWDYWANSGLRAGERFWIPGPSGE